MNAIFPDWSRRPALHALSDLWQDRVDLHVYCNIFPPRCYRHVHVDLLAMILEYGDLRVVDVKRRLTCKVCGFRSGTISLSTQGGVPQPRRPFPDGFPLILPAPL